MAHTQEKQVGRWRRPGSVAQEGHRRRRRWRRWRKVAQGGAGGAWGRRWRRKAQAAQEGAGGARRRKAAQGGAGGAGGYGPKPATLYARTPYTMARAEKPQEDREGPRRCRREPK